MFQVQYVKVKLKGMANKNAVIQHISHLCSHGLKVYAVYEILWTDSADRSAIIRNLHIKEKLSTNFTKEKPYLLEIEVGRICHRVLRPVD